jgi:GT2 family glycosyltransferase
MIDTVQQLKKQLYRKYEIIIVDQSSSYDLDIQNQIDELLDSKTRYFRVSPRSVTAAKNFGITKAKGKVLVFLDDDIKIKKDFLKNHAQAYMKYPDAGAIAGRVLQKGFPIIDKILKFNKYGQSEGTYTGSKDGETNTFPGGNCSVKKEVAVGVGGFDTRYYGGSFREESDFANKVHNAGYKIYYYHKAEIFHLAAPSGGNRVKNHIYDNPSFYANELFFTLRTVKVILLPISILIKFRQYCISRNILNSIKRSILFVVGFMRALLRLVIPKKVLAKEVH